MPDLRKVWPRFDRFTEAGQAGGRARAMRIAGLVVPGILLAYLTYRLTQIGWAQVWQARPRSWLYYLVLAASFFVQPAADLLVYRNLWRISGRPRLSILLRKRLLNSAVLDYSGDAYFFGWAAGRLALPRAAIAHSIKDSSILSAGAGLVTVWLMLLAVVLSGEVRLPIPPSALLWLCLGMTLLPLPLCVVLVAARRKVTTLSFAQLGSTFAIHLSRSLLSQGLQFALWLLSGALTSSSLCLDFVVLRLLVSRLPFVPGKDLVFVGAGLAAAQLLDASPPAVAAALMTMITGELLLNLGLVGLPWLIGNVSGPAFSGGNGD
jgi:hypothetical protein